MYLQQIREKLLKKGKGILNIIWMVSELVGSPFGNNPQLQNIVSKDV